MTKLMQRVILALALFNAFLWSFLITTKAIADESFKMPCNIGISVGANASATKTDNGGTVIALGTQAPIGGFEVGCAYFMSHSAGTFGLHGIGRVDLTDTSAEFNLTSLKSNTRWSALAGLSYELNKNVSLMALGGVSQTKWSLQDIQASQTLGLTYGGRLTFDIGQSNVAAFLEVTQTSWRGLNLGGQQVKPSDTIARAGVTISFGK